MDYFFKNIYCKGRGKEGNIKAYNLFYFRGLLCSRYGGTNCASFEMTSKTTLSF